MKKSLVMTVAAMVMAACTGTALAGNYSIGHPFYTPDKDGRMFATSVGYGSWKYDNFPGMKTSSVVATECLTYGASDKTTVFGSVWRDWERQTADSYGVRTGHFNSWDVGAVHKFVDNGKTFLAGLVSYEQYYTKKMPFYGKDMRTYWVRATYGRTYKTVTPYLSLDYANALNLGENNDGIFTAEANVYKQFNRKLGASLGIGYSHKTAQTGAKECYANWSLTYTFTDKCALMVSGSVNLSDKQDDVVMNIFGNTYNFNYESKNKYDIGCTLKLAF